MGGHKALLLLLAAPTLLSAQKPLARQMIPLDVAVEDAADIWSRADGTGYANDIVRAAFRAGGVEPHFIVVPYARCKAMVSEASVPACFSMSRDSSVPASIVFSDSANFTFRSDYFERVDRPLSVDRAGVPRRGTTVGIVRGYEYADTIRALAHRGILQLVTAGSETTNLRKLADGRLDATFINVDDMKNADELLVRAGVSGRVRRALRGPALPAFVGFNLRHSQGTLALARYNAGRRAIAFNGSLARIRRAWSDSALVMRRRAP